MFELSNRSEDELSTCHEDLQLVMREAIKVTRIDFGVLEGNRPIEIQKKYFDEGKSQIDGITKKGKHNVMPSLAVDIFAYINGRADWGIENMCYLAGVILSVADRLYKEEKIKSRIRWGGNWDHWANGVNYGGFVDTPHYEIK